MDIKKKEIHCIEHIFPLVLCFFIFFFYGHADFGSCFENIAFATNVDHIYTTYLCSLTLVYSTLEYKISFIGNMYLLENDFEDDSDLRVLENPNILWSRQLFLAVKVNSDCLLN